MLVCLVSLPVSYLAYPAKDCVSGEHQLKEASITLMGKLTSLQLDQ